MLFPQRVDVLPRKTGLALGSVNTFEITREFHIEALLIRADLSSITAMATANPDSIQQIIKRIKLTVSDGARTRNVIDISGPALLEYIRQLFGSLDANTRAAVGTNTTSAKQLTFYVPFTHPQIDDPNGSTLLLPAPRFNQNPVLEITLASQADMDTNGSPTFAATTALTVTVIRRQVGVKGWPTYDTELVEKQAATWAATGANQTYDLDVPGSYTGILIRGYTSSTARGNPFTANGFVAVGTLGTILRRWIVTDLESLNAMSMTEASSNLFTASYYLDFLSDRAGNSLGDLGSVLDTNILAGTGARAQLIHDIGTASSITKYVTHRIFGDLKPLKLGQG